MRPRSTGWEEHKPPGRPRWFKQNASQLGGAKFNKPTIKVDRPQLSPADIKKLEEAMKEKAKSD